jgi:hypothetical protein
MVSLMGVLRLVWVGLLILGCLRCGLLVVSVSPILRQMILSDRDALSVEEFIVKVDLWGRLLREETVRKRNYY